MKIWLLTFALFGCDRALEVPEEAPGPGQTDVGSVGHCADTCPMHSYCAFPTGSCGTDGATGACQGQPRDCVGANKQPECGCDQKTYENDCDREIAGVSLLHTGACTDAATCQSAGGYCEGDYATYPCKSGYHMVSSTVPAGCGFGVCCYPD